MALCLREEQPSPVCARAKAGHSRCRQADWQAQRPHLGVWVVAPPVWPDAGLPPQVPDLELDVLVGHCLYIEANGCSRHIPESSCRCKQSAIASSMASQLLSACLMHVSGIMSRDHGGSGLTRDCGDDFPDLQSVCSAKQWSSGDVVAQRISAVMYVISGWIA